MILDLLKGEITQQELLNIYNANITYIKMSNRINGFIFCYMNINNIFINKNLSFYKKRKTILHELAHIELNHLNQINKDLFGFHIEQYEDEADKYLRRILKELTL